MIWGLTLLSDTCQVFNSIPRVRKCTHFILHKKALYQYQCIGGVCTKRKALFFANKRHIVTNLELIYSSVTCVPQTALHHMEEI